MTKIFIGLFLLLSASLVGENSYQEEIDAIYLRTATLIEHGRVRIDQVGSFKNAWAGIGFYSSQLAELIQIHTPPSYFPEDPDLYALHALTFEKVFIDALQERLTIFLPKIEENLQIAEGVTAQNPDLKDLQNPLRDQLLAELFQLGEVLKARREQADTNLQLWREWQMGVALQAELAHQGVIEDRLEVINDIGQIRGIFNRLWLNTFQKIYERDFPESQQMLKGYSWFKSVIPLYFSDKISTPDQADFLKEVLAEAEEKENELTAQYHLLSGHMSWRIYAEEEGDRGDHEGEEHEGGAEDKDNFPKDPRDVIDIGSRMDPGSTREFTLEKYEGGFIAVSSLSISKEVCKYDEAGNGTAKITAEGNGFVKYDPEHTPVDKVDLPSGPELQRSIDNGITTTSFKFEGSVPCDPKTEKESQEFNNKIDHFGKMIDQAKQQAKKEEDKKGLQDLENALQDFQNYQNQVNSIIQDKVNGIRNAQDTVQKNIRGISKSLPPAPKIKTPPSVDRAHVLDQLDKIRQSIWNFAVSSGRAISQALGTFIQSLADGAPAPLQGAAKAVIEAAQQHSQPSKPIPKMSFIPINSSIRTSILTHAKSLRDGSKIIKYSQANRLGPDSYDCSGFVTSMYAAAGLPFGHPNVQGIIALTKTNGPFKEVSVDEAKPGDLVVWRKDEGENTYNHVAIFDGNQTVKGENGLAVVSTSSSASEKGDNAIREILIKYMIGDRDNPIFHIYQWTKQ